MKRVLVLDGGGVKGFGPAVVLAEIERKTGTRISDLFDLIVGTSVGAILGATAASGRYTAGEILTQMGELVPKMFTRQFLPPFPKYSRKAFVEFWLEKYETITMSDLHTKFLCTSVDMVTGSTHYFKSWEKKDGTLPTLDAVLRSFAAPVFFGSIADEKDQRVWIDGGTGEENCPLLEAIIESLRQRWLGDERLHILSIGCGSKSNKLMFKDAKNYHWLRQAFYFLDPDDGGLARQQSTENAVQMAAALGGLVPEYSFQRIDATIDKKIDKLDGVKYISQYVDVGRKMATAIDYETLLG